MRILQFHSVGGASGDMILGALIALGADRKTIADQLGRLVPEAFSLDFVSCESHGINGHRLTVKLAQPDGHHHHDHKHGHHHHEHHSREHHHRDFKCIRSMIEESDLPTSVKESSIAVFYRIAVAEGKIHGKAPEEVHFHEVGALDSILDIVGACLAIDQLKVDRVEVGPLPLGCGTITCQHGTYPCPAPATLAILSGMNVQQTQEPYELVTPTGAALLAEWGTGLASSGTMGATAYSFGHRKLDHRPNVLRAVLLESVDAAESLRVLECNLDDCSPEWIGHLSTVLIQAGALDVWCTAIQMKKQRPGSLLSVLVASDKTDEMTQLIFAHSTTFGVRSYAVDRTALERQMIAVETRFGPVQCKIGLRNGVSCQAAPEMDDCIRLSEAFDCAPRAVYEAASAALMDVDP